MPSNTSEGVDILTGSAVKLVFVKSLALGSFGRVDHFEFRRELPENGKPLPPGTGYAQVAVKSPTGDNGSGLIEMEGKILRDMSHSAIVNLEAVISDGRGGYRLVEEFVEGPTLNNLLARQLKLFPRKKLYTHLQAVRWMLQLASALNHMHSRPDGRVLIHRDISISNIMLTSFSLDKANLKLVDFGLAKDLNPGMSSQNLRNQADLVCGTLLHMAPEIVTQKSYDEKVDIFSMAMVMFQVFNYTSMTTFLHHSGFTMKDGQAAIVSGWRPPVIPSSENCPECIANLIERCWSADPGLRPSAAEVVAELTVYLEDASAGYQRKPSAVQRFLKSFKGLGLAQSKKSACNQSNSRQSSTRQNFVSNSDPGLSPAMFQESGNSSRPLTGISNTRKVAEPMQRRRTLHGVIPEAMQDRASVSSVDPDATRRRSSIGGLVSNMEILNNSLLQARQNQGSASNAPMFDEVARSLTPISATLKVAQPVPRRESADGGCSNAQDGILSLDTCRYAI